VLRRLKELDWGRKRFKEETGIWPQTVLHEDHVRADYVVTVARALGMDVGQALEDADWKNLTLLQRRIIEYLASYVAEDEIGRRYTVLAQRAGIALPEIGGYLRNGDRIPREDVLAKLAPVLEFGDEDLKTIRAQRHHAPHSAESRRQAVQTRVANDPDCFSRGASERGKAAWDDRRAMLDSLRKAGAERRIPIDEAWLRERKNEGLSDKKIADMVGCSGEVVRDHVYEFRIRPGRTQRIRQLNRRKQKRLEEGRKAGQKAANDRRSEDAQARIHRVCEAHRTSGRGPTRTSLEKDHGFSRPVIRTHVAGCPYH
jgi:hypothetical protein